MSSDRNPGRFEVPPVEGRQVVAAFDGGAIASDAGALLLGADQSCHPADLALRDLLRPHTHPRAGRVPG